MFPLVRRLFLLSPLLTTQLFSSSIVVYQDIGFIDILVLTITIIVGIFLLAAQHSLAKTMKNSVPTKHTHGFWIWTQMIPFWSFISMPITLIKLKAQFRHFLDEHDITLEDVTSYNHSWGWFLYVSIIISILFPSFTVITLIGMVTYNIHIVDVKKSILAFQQSTIRKQRIEEIFNE